MDEFERDLANARAWSRIIGVTGLTSLAVCIIAAVTKKPGDDWLAVILFAALTGLCAFAEVVLAVLYYQERREQSRSTTTGSA